MLLLIPLLKSVFLLVCGVQCVGANFPIRWQVVSDARFSSAAVCEAPSLLPIPAETAAGAEEDHRRGRPALHAAAVLHFRLQACTHTDPTSLSIIRSRHL